MDPYLKLSTTSHYDHSIHHTSSLFFTPIQKHAPTLLTLQPHSPTFLLNSSEVRDNPLKHIHSNTISRRISIAAILLAKEATFNVEVATAGFDLRMTVPDQTIVEAKSTVKSHEENLRDNVKILLDSESWRDAQKVLRKSSSLLKQDIYTIIQAKPGRERPLLRQLYSQLFNNVTKLDYAARSKDATLVQECYKNIINALDNIMSRL